MTLTVTIAVHQGQAFGAKVNVVEQYGEAPPVVASSQELQPGDCYQTYLTSCRKFEITEIPLKTKEV